MQVCTSLQATTPAPTTQFFTGRMPFLPPNQQRQSTEGTKALKALYTKSKGPNGHSHRSKTHDMQ